jgi:hypothetical protein
MGAGLIELSNTAPEQCFGLGKKGPDDVGTRRRHLVQRTRVARTLTRKEKHDGHDVSKMLTHPDDLLESGWDILCTLSWPEKGGVAIATEVVATWRPSSRHICDDRFVGHPG